MRSIRLNGGKNCADVDHSNKTRNSSEEKAMRTIKNLADVARQRVFADFGTFVLEHLVRSAGGRVGAKWRVA